MSLVLRRASIALAFSMLAACGETTPSGFTPTVEMSATDLRLELRGLLEERTAWTRAYIVDVLEELPGREASHARLIENGAELGARVALFYGPEAGTAFAGLLEASLDPATAALEAAMANDAAGFATARSDWYAAADEVAAFLAGANPAWELAALEGLLHGCIDDAIAEASMRLMGMHDAELDAFRAHEAHAATVADALASGIGAQFPDNVSLATVPASEESLRLALRGLFFERATGVRQFVADAAHGLGSMSESEAFLLQNNRDIAGAIEGYYGAEAAAALVTLLDLMVGDARSAVGAALEGNTAGFEAAVSAWHGRENELAAFLAGANPNWPEAALSTMLNACVDRALAVAMARMGGNFAAEIEAQGTLVTQSRAVADALADGLIAQFPGR